MWVAVAGEHYLPGLEVEGEHGYQSLGDGEAIDDGIGDVLVVHDLEHPWDHHLTGRVERLSEVGLFITLCQQFSDACGTHLGQFLFIGLGIVVVVAADETVAVAYEPDLAAHTAVDDGRGREAFLGMCGHAALGEAQPVMAADGFGNPLAELLAADVGRHVTDIAADEQHGIAPVAPPREVAAGGLRSGAVDDGDEVICDDDSVLAFLRGALRNDAFLYDIHCSWDCWGCLSRVGG